MGRESLRQFCIFWNLRGLYCCHFEVGESNTLGENGYRETNMLFVHLQPLLPLSHVSYSSLYVSKAWLASTSSLLSLSLGTAPSARGGSYLLLQGDLWRRTAVYWPNHQLPTTIPCPPTLLHLYTKVPTCPDFSHKYKTNCLPNFKWNMLYL